MRYFLLPLITCLSLMISPVFAQGADNASQNLSVSEQKIETLIDTLENEADRKDFIDNLKTLIEAQDEEEQNTISAPSITETLGIEQQTQSVIKGYSAFLASHNLNTSTVGKTGLTVAAFLALFILGFITKKITMTLLQKLLGIKQKYRLTHSRFAVYVRAIRYSAYLILTLLCFTTIGLIWNVTDFGFLQSDTVTSLVGNIVNVLTIVLITAFLWEGVNGTIEYTFRKSGTRDSGRVKTLLPIMRNVLFMLFMALFGLMMLSELGINIMPLLAGAGIFGVAIGFGAQKMVKDFLTGFTIILEDLMQVGDVVTLAGRTGWVEKITIRKAQLRALDGTVYTVPFSEVEIIENQTKDFSYYLMDVGIAYRENPDDVITYLKEIDEEMRSDEDFERHILESIEILGVDHFADSAVIIKARIKTRPLKQWEVGREFNRRMKHKFDEKNVEMPFPHQTIYFGEDKDGKAPPAPIKIEGKELTNDSSEEKDAA